eukprot:gi/632974057/ref/XP_007903460.1/ PREDICTED: palladin isoform X2 [Callorhinchus milii]
MQARNYEHNLPLSQMLKEAYSAREREVYCANMMSEASSHDMYFDSLSDFQEDGADGAELSAFLTQEEMSKSLDLAREAFEDSLSQEATLDAELENVSNCFQHYPSVTNPAIPETKAVSQPDCPQPSVSRTAQEISTSSKHMGSADDSHRAAIPRHPLLDQSHRPDLGRDGLAIGNFHASGMSVPHKENTTTDPKGNQKCVYQSESSARNEFRSKAVSFIEELSSIFRTVRPRSLETETGKSIEEDNSSPDSGYLSPKSHAKATSAATEQSKSSEAKLQVVADLESRDETEQSWAMDQTTAGDLHASDSAPRFIQKLKSQEVAEGSTVRLECRVTGNPSLLIRWFCEDKELQNSPDIQIFQNGDLYSLIIAEAFEDDTGRYTCLATNHLGSDTTSAEVYIEGTTSTDSEGEGTMFQSQDRTVPQTKKKTASVSLTIGSPPPKAGTNGTEVQQLRSTLVQSISLPPQPIQSPTLCLQAQQDGGTAPSFTKVLQDISAFDGQVVVLECRIKGAPLVRVQWFRQGTEIEDSPDFRILQKKPRSASEPEEICTLVIAETFPEDAGIFTCVATNHLGSVSCRAELTLHTGSEDAMDNGTGLADNHTVSPQTEISSLQLPPKRTIDHVQVNSLEIKPSVAALQLQLNTAEKEPNGTSSHQATNGLNQEQPTALPSPIKEPPPLLTKPKLDPLKLQQLQNQVLLEQQGAAPGQQLQFNYPPPSPLSNLSSPAQMNVLNSHTPSAMHQTTTFNYARPKQFIAAQSLSSSSTGYISPSSGSSGSSISSPLSPPTSHRSFNRAPLPLFTQPHLIEAEQHGLTSASALNRSSPSPPLPPPPVFSPFTAYANDSFPLPPPPPPLLSPTAQPSYFSPSGGGRASPHSSQSPAAFLSSMLPSQPIPLATVNALGLPKGAIAITPQSLKKQTRAGRLATDEEIQGTKNAVIQDLERKLRFKDDRLSNGQKLTYEEKMARRLLGADSAATVFSCQETEEEPVAQDLECIKPSESCSEVTQKFVLKEYKVSTFEQRLISEIEFRLERSQVDESDDEVQHDEQSAEGMVPMFEKKLKHVKLFEGMPITIACKVTGEPMPKVYWFKDGKQISKRSEHYKIHREGDGTCSLSTEAATLDDDGNYTIMLANPLGRTSCTARLMVQTVSQRGRSPRSPLGQSNVRRPRSRSRDSGEEPESIQERFFRPHFLQAPGDMIVQEGKLCRMDCKVSGLPTPDLIWQLNGNQIHSDANHKMLVRENGIHSLVIEPVTAKDAGIYTCIATNRAGQNFFNLELLVAAKEMVRAPVFIEKLQNTGVAEGYPVRLECRVSGVPYPQIFWKKDNESLTQNTERVSIHHDNKGYICLLIQPTTKEDAAWYTVSAKNEAGIISCTAKLDVLAPQWHQTPISKPKKVRPSTSRYAALTDQGLDIKSAFLPEANPVHLTSQHDLVESDDL